METFFRGASGGQFSYDGAFGEDGPFLDGGEVLSFGIGCFFLLCTLARKFSAIDLVPSPVEEVPIDAVDWFCEAEVFFDPRPLDPELLDCSADCRSETLD